MLVPSHTLLPRGDINQLFNTHHEYDYAQVTDILQGGLNLNLFGALSGALSSTSKKTTHNNADGSSTSVEDRHDQGKEKPRLSPSATAFPIREFWLTRCPSEGEGRCRRQRERTRCCVCGARWEGE